MSPSRPVRAFSGRSGSAISPRATFTMSALPEAMISSISSGSERAPTVETLLQRMWGLMAAAYFTLTPSGRNMLGHMTVNASSKVAWPTETWMMSG